MPQNVSPGVYIRELDLSVYIPQLSTTIVGMVGTSPRGPIDTPTFISSAAQFTATFGDPTPNHLSMYAALQYLRHGSQLWFVRVNGSTASTAASSTINGQATAAYLRSSLGGPYTFTEAAPATLLGTEDGDSFTVDATNDKLLIAVDDGPQVTITLTQGAARTAAQVAADIDTALAAHGADAAAAAGAVQIVTTGSGSSHRLALYAIPNSAYTLLGLAVGPVSGVGDTTTLEITTQDRSSGATVEDTETFELHSAASGSLADVVTYLNTEIAALGTFPVTVSAVANRLQIMHTSTGQDFGVKVTSNQGTAGLGAVPTLGFAEGAQAWGYGKLPLSKTFDLEAASVGTWGNDLTVTFLASTVPGAFSATVTYKGEVVELFEDLVPNPEDVDTDVGTRYFATVFDEESRFVAVVDEVENTGLPVFGTYLFSGGDDGLESVGDEEYVGTISGEVRTGLELFSDPERRNGGDVNLLLVPGVSSAAVINKLLSTCQNRGDCMCIIDPPFDLSVQQVVDWHNGAGGYDDHQPFNSSFGALYYSWVREYDPAAEQHVWVPPSGYLAGVYAFSDYNTEVWFAPAGITRGRILEGLEVRYSPDQGQRDFLYGSRNAINPLVNFTREGITVWGQRTLQRKPTALDRVNVRRLILYLRKVLATTYRTIVFEPNDRRTWRQVVALTEPFLATIQARRGIEEFQVVCDETINTPDVIDNNELRVVILVDPTNTAERIQVDIAITRTGAVFDETTRQLAGLPA